MGPTLQLANATYARIRSLAVRDAQLWATGIDIDRGYQQIVSECSSACRRLHTTTQLKQNSHRATDDIHNGSWRSRGLNAVPVHPTPRSVYGPNGSYPLIPGTQPAPAASGVRVTSVAAAVGADVGGWQFTVFNPGADALDLSGWKVQGPTAPPAGFKLPEGACVSECRHFLSSASIVF